MAMAAEVQDHTTLVIRSLSPGARDPAYERITRLDHRRIIPPADGSQMGDTGIEFSRGVWQELRPRIGERRQARIPVRWAVSGPGSSARRWWRRARIMDAVVTDISVSGARLLVQPGAELTVRSQLELEIGGVWTSARVMWIEPTGNDSARLCGLMFINPADCFMAAVSCVLDPV